MSFTNFSSGKSHAFGGRYLEFVPGEKLRYEDRFEDPNMPGAMDVSITFKEVSVGTELSRMAGVAQLAQDGGRAADSGLSASRVHDVHPANDTR